MPRVFAYCRVSTLEQTTENQRREIEVAGFSLRPQQLIGRIHSGMARAKAAGKRSGRPPAMNEEQQRSALERLNAGASVSVVAREFNTSRQTPLSIREARQV